MIMMMIWLQVWRKMLLIMVVVVITQAMQNALIQVFTCFIDCKKAFQSAPNTRLISSFTNVQLKPYDRATGKTCMAI